MCTYTLTLRKPKVSKRKEKEKYKKKLKRKHLYFPPLYSQKYFFSYGYAKPKLIASKKPHTDKKLLRLE